MLLICLGQTSVSCETKLFLGGVMECGYVIFSHHIPLFEYLILPKVDNHFILPTLLTTQTLSLLA